MSNKRKSLIVVSAGLVVLLNVMGSLFIVKTMSKTVDVLVVKESLTPRSEIQKEHLEVVSMPKNTIPMNIYVDAEDVIGKVVSFDASLYQGMFLFKEAIEDPELTSDAPLLRLKQSQVAVSMGVDVLKSLGNTLLTGQYVDVVITLEPFKGNPIVETIFHNVRVLSIKDRYGLDMSHPKSQRAPAVVLLAINHEDANDFYLAKNKGEIDLVPLRSGQIGQDEASKNMEAMVWGILHE